MGHNPSRSTRKEIAVSAQYDVDLYKSRSIWGPWRGMKREVRNRYFNAEEIGWLNRYGAKLDQLASLTLESATPAQHHFIAVCLGHEEPSNDGERLWLRAQMVVRYQVSLERAARCGEAERQRDAILAKYDQLEEDMRDVQMHAAGTWAEAEIEFRDQLFAAVQRYHGLCNVKWVTWLFRQPEIVGPRQAWRVISEPHHAPAVGYLTPAGLVAA